MNDLERDALLARLYLAEDAADGFDPESAEFAYGGCIVVCIIIGFVVVCKLFDWVIWPIVELLRG